MQRSHSHDVGLPEHRGKGLAEARELEPRTTDWFAENLLLATFPDSARPLIEPFGEVVELELGDLVLESGRDVAYSYFPYRPAMVSLVVDLEDGRSVEVASIGHEGAIGGIVSCGHAPAYSHGRVIVEGRALRVPMDRIEQIKSQSGHVRNLFCRYSDYLLAQVMQSVACAAHHPLEARAARWLLTAMDRAGDSFQLTQEALANLLGAQRTTVNAVAKTLADEGLIRYSRGRIRLLDRSGLEQRSCACYRDLEGFFGNIIGPKGNGGSADCD